MTKPLACVQDLTVERLEASLATCREEVKALIDHLSQFGVALDPVRILDVASSESNAAHTSKRLLVCALFFILS